jgi:signal transduction histidine kinase
MKKFKDWPLQYKVILPLLTVVVLAGSGIILALIEEHNEITASVLPKERALQGIRAASLEVLNEYRELMIAYNDDAREEVDDAIEEIAAHAATLGRLTRPESGSPPLLAALDAAVEELKQRGDEAIAVRLRLVDQVQRLEDFEGSGEGLSATAWADADAVDAKDVTGRAGPMESRSADELDRLLQEHLSELREFGLMPNDATREEITEITRPLQDILQSSDPDRGTEREGQAFNSAEREKIRQLLEVGHHIVVLAIDLQELMERLEKAEDGILEILKEFEVVVAAQTDETLEGSLTTIGIIILSTLMLITGVGFSLSISIGGSVSALTKAVNRMAEGDLSARAAVRSRDEIGRLASAFNNMAERLETNIHRREHAEGELRALNDHLEAKVTERTAEVEAQARNLQQALKAQVAYNSLQREFVSMVSHEFRTPLTIIDSTAQRIIRRPERLSTEELVKRIGNIRTAVTSMVGLMESTLSAEQLEAGKITMTPQAVDITELLISVQSRQQEASPSHKIELNLETLPNEIEGDPRLLEQAFTNLLSNAVKYSPRNGRVQITGRREGNSVLVVVQDYGVGIPADEQPRLFQRFFRARTAIGIPGTGVGLYLVKRFVEMHGGSVEVESLEGEGSSFSVRLPIKRSEEQAVDSDDSQDQCARPELTAVAGR